MALAAPLLPSILGGVHVGNPWRGAQLAIGVTGFAVEGLGVVFVKRDRSTPQRCASLAQHLQELQPIHIVVIDRIATITPRRRVLKRTRKLDPNRPGNWRRLC